MVSCCISRVESVLAYSVDTLCNFRYDYRAVHDCHVAEDNESRELQEEWFQQRAGAAEGGKHKLTMCHSLKQLLVTSFTQSKMFQTEILCIHPS